MFREPYVHVEEEILFAPEHPGHRLAHDESFIFADTGWGYGFVELIRLTLTGPHGRGEALERIADGGRRRITEPQADGGCLSRTHIQLVVRRRLGPRLPRVDRLVLSLNDVVVDPVFYIRRQVCRAEDSFVVRLIFREQQRDFSLAVQIPLTQIGV